MCSISPRTYSLSFFTIKVLTHFFQVYCLHKSFSLSLPRSPYLPSFSKENLNMSWRDQSPDIYSRASPLLIFSPLLYFSPNCLIRLLLSTIGYQQASEASLLMQPFDLHTVRCRLFICFSVKSVFFFHQIILMPSLTSWLFVALLCRNQRFLISN